MNQEQLQIIAEFVDRASAGIKKAQGAFDDLTRSMQNTAGAENRVSDAVRDTGRAASGAGAGVLALASQFKQLAVVAIAVTAAVTGFVDAIAYADKLDDLSDKTGLAASNLKELDYAATLSGSSLDGLIGAFNKLGKAADMSDEETSKQARTFEQLGVSAADANGKLKSNEQLFYDLADAFQGIEDGPEKSAAAFRLFGGEAKNLLPLLNKGSAGIRELKEESAALAGVAPEAFTAFAQAAGTFNDNIDKGKVVANGFFTLLASELVPVINTMAEAILNSAKEGGILRQVMTGLVEVFKFMIPYVKASAEVFSGFVSTVQIAGKSIGAVMAAIAVVASGGGVAGLKAVWGAYKEDVQGVAQAHVTFTEKLNGTYHEAVKLADGVDKPTRSIKSLGKAAKDAKSSLEEMVNGLRATARSGGDETLKQLIEANQKYAADIKAGLSPAREKQLLAEATALIVQARALKEAATEQEAYDAARGTLADATEQAELLEYEATLIGKNADERAALIEKFKEEAVLRKVVAGLGETDVVRIAEETRALNERLAIGKKAASDAQVANEIFDQSLGQLQDSFSARIQVALRLFEEGKINIDDFTRYQTAAYDELLNKTKTVADESTLFWTEAAKGIQSSFQSIFFDFMQGNLDDLGSRFKKLFDQIVSNALAAKASAAFLGSGFEKTGQLGGLAGAGLSAFSNFFGGFRASGGPVKAGKSYVVGEHRAELFTPRQSGYISPSVETQGGGAPVVVQMTVQAIDTKDFIGKIKDSDRELVKIVRNAQKKWNIS